ncbi:MAG TPA: GTP 3',8-cyclase MoaA [Terriglobales bacterium]|nr:GTP 3',8-cyclase MoaA [Terriglobales bacterium]
MDPVRDTYGRPLRSLRISVTDRCNLRCEYCMPQEDYVWLERSALLSFEEITELATIFASAGVEKLRLTGGEPLLRRNLDRLVLLLAQVPGIRDLALTTNGLQLAQHAAAFRQAGLQRVTVSLDTLRPERFTALTRRTGHQRVLEGIAAAQAADFASVKINAVIMRGFNHDELADLVEFGRAHRAEVRFIEYMDVGGATRWSSAQVFSAAEMLRILAERYGPITPLAPHDSAAPAERYRLPDGVTFGIISSTTRPFCGSCDRARITADGMFFRCLYAHDGTDLKRLLRAQVAPDEILATLRRLWADRADRGAEDRLALKSRAPLFRAEDLKANPHHEMHTRGG